MRGLWGAFWTYVLSLGICCPTTALARGFDATIVETPYGVAHVTARDYAGLGYGAAYAYARENVCILATQLVTIRGERSKVFGPEGATNLSFNPATNLDSDFYFRSVPDLPALRRAFAQTSSENQALTRGWVAGYNRYLRDTPPSDRPAACAGVSWVRPMTLDDALLITDNRARYMSAAFVGSFIATAQPPDAAQPPKPSALSSLLPRPEEFGSNAWAFGRDVTANGSGILLGNPHVPWTGGIRFFEIHLTIPGKLDVMGAMNSGGPVVTMGFNQDLAWSHTVASDRHFTVYELALDPADPTVYLIDGKRYPMRRTTVSVEGASGSAPQTRTLYSTVYGPVLATPQTPWTRAHAYAVADANANNQREGDAWLAVARSRSVGELRQALIRHDGISWSNTVATDRRGEVLYADITPVPNVSAAKLAACAPKAVQQVLGGLFVLDGSRSSCAWEKAPGAVVSGLTPAAAMPVLARTDYVQNANDSYWLTNLKAPLGAYSPLMGRIGIPQGPRTRAALTVIEDRIADGKIDPETVKAMLFENRSFVAGLVLEDLLSACQGKADRDVAEGCSVLRRWDQRMELDSVGGLLFTEFWRRAAAIPEIWKTPFDPTDPVRTPRGLRTDGQVGGKVFQALAGAVTQMRSRGLPLDAPLGRLQFVTAGSERVPIHGGESQIGVLNAISSQYSPKDGGFRPYTGSTFIQVVTFDGQGPVADAVLTHSQSSDPASPHAFDQTRLYSAKRWVRLPFLKADVDRQAVGAPLKIAE